MELRTQSKVTGAVLMAAGCSLDAAVLDGSGGGARTEMRVLKTACVGSRPIDFDVNLGQYLEHERKLLDIIRKARETG